MKCETGNVKSENLSLHSDGESRKRSRASTSWSGDEDPVSLVQRLQSHFDVCFTELSTKIKDGFSSCEQKIKALSDKVVAVEQSIRSPRAPAEDKDDDDDEDNTLPDVPDVGVSTKSSPKNQKAKDRKSQRLNQRAKARKK